MTGKNLSRGTLLFRVLGPVIYIASAMAAGYGAYIFGANLMGSFVGGIACFAVGWVISTIEAFGFGVRSDIDRYDASRRGERLTWAVLTIACIIATNCLQVFATFTMAMNDAERTRDALSAQQNIQASIERTFDDTQETASLDRSREDMLAARQEYEDFRALRRRVAETCRSGVYCSEGEVLQVELGVVPDGDIGPVTSAAARAKEEDLRAILDRAETRFDAASARMEAFETVLTGEEILDKQARADQADDILSGSMRFMMFPGISAYTVDDNGERIRDLDASITRAVFFMMVFATIIFALLSCLFIHHEQFARHV